MEAHEEGDEIFVYMGGHQEVPEHVRRARIYEDVNIIRRLAFYNRRHLLSVEFHDGVEIIEENAFMHCVLLCGSIKLLGVKIIREASFFNCCRLTDVEFGDKLETIGQEAFGSCTSLRTITMPSARTIGKKAFSNCFALTDLDLPQSHLTDLELPEELETLQRSAFGKCECLRRITMPLKDGMIEYGVFNYCPDLTTVVTVGGMHKTIASLHLDSWRNEMTGEIKLINQTLPNTEPRVKTRAIQQWMRSVTRHLNHYNTRLNTTTY